MAQFPCFFIPLAESLLSPFFVFFTYLETFLSVTGSVHLGPRLLVNWPPLPQPFPIPSPLQIPSTQVNKRLTTTTSRIRLLLSGTCIHFLISLAEVTIGTGDFSCMEPRRLMYSPAIAWPRTIAALTILIGDYSRKCTIFSRDNGKCKKCQRWLH